MHLCIISACEHITEVLLPTSLSPDLMNSLESASLTQCTAITRKLSARLSALKMQHTGMSLACLEEAAQLLSDAASDMDAAYQAIRAAPCACGHCDDCVAAGLDSLYDRRRDAALSP